MFASQTMYENLRMVWPDRGSVPELVLHADDDSAMPSELRSWLVQLRLASGVPFANLVSDAELLPPESIRWFYMDRRWTDALVQGALSVGTVNSDDRIQLTNEYPAIREELDDEERNVRRLPGIPRRTSRLGAAAATGTGDAGPITGFLLRSAVVSGWPGLHVRALNVDSGPAQDEELISETDERRVRLLRLERLAPAVLLCLFDGVPKVVHIEEPRQGIQFGFDFEGNGTQRSATLTPRAVTNTQELGTSIDVPFRSGSSGVVDIRRLAEALGEIDEVHTDAGGTTGTLNDLDSAEYALQLVRFPHRRVYGDVDNGRVVDLFRPTISYATHRRDFEEFDYVTGPATSDVSNSNGGI